MKSYFIYQGPHYVHADWARSVGCKFIHFRFHKQLVRSKLSKVIMRTHLLWFRKPTFVIAEGGAPLIEAALLKVTKETPIIYLASDITPYRILEGRDELLKELIEFSNLTVAISKMVLEDTSRLCLLREHDVVYPFVREKFFDYKERARKDEKKAVFVGNLLKHKGADLLPEVTETIRRKMKDFKLMVIGKPIEVGLKESYGLKSLGLVPLNILMREVSSSKVYIHPARYEPFGVSVAEAVVLGTLPVVSNKTGIKELLPGDLVANSLNELVEKTIYILGLDRGEYEELLIKTKKRLEPKIKREKSIKLFKTLIEDFLSDTN